MQFSTTNTNNPGLGAAFLAEVRRCTTAILEYPDAGPVVHAAIRRRLCLRFPYGVLYSVGEEEIRVLAIMNLKRRPNYWVGRT